MAGAESSGLGLARVHLACGRIVGVARALVEACRFGAPEGHCGGPWTAQYHAEAAHVYGRSLPAGYQREMASLSRHCVDTMRS